MFKHVFNDRFKILVIATMIFSHATVPLGYLENLIGFPKKADRVFKVLDDITFALMIFLVTFFMATVTFVSDRGDDVVDRHENYSAKKMITRLLDCNLVN